MLSAITATASRNDRLSRPNQQLVTVRLGVYETVIPRGLGEEESAIAGTCLLSASVLADSLTRLFRVEAKRNDGLQGLLRI